MNYYKVLDIVYHAIKLLKEEGRDIYKRILIVDKIVDEEAKSSIE